jgi:hypothetical protein
MQAHSKDRGVYWTEAGKRLRAVFVILKEHGARVIRLCASSRRVVCRCGQLSVATPQQPLRTASADE